eukprot:gnl/TRDRNA2_/TRDRNA2_94172_c0_seq1.p1 gnl/TRDRNA2_/TRDRNA2_94172_c0~~gnl/TRDRNA2_/TRDRNA2_94172_c0_seq1.p1  ORF type:complete len:597 (-),score=112.17 gnl/TRDRNA2_/TRDRNA2_94172_c0_seq1:82-1872(-)
MLGSPLFFFDMDHTVLLNFIGGLAMGAAIIFFLQSREENARAKMQQKRKNVKKLPRRKPKADSVVSENVRWMDVVVAEVWPRVSTYLNDLMHDTVEPLIDKALHGAAKVRFTKVSLGDALPKLGPLEMHDAGSGAIELTIGIDLVSNLDVEITVTPPGIWLGITVGVTELRFAGEISVMFRPPLEKPPFFGGIEIFFANPPDIDLVFTGIARLVEVPGLRSAVRSVIDQVLGKAMVLPNRIAVDLNNEDDVDIADLKSPDPLGILRVTLWRGQDLLPSDISYLGQARTSDPYVVMALGCDKWTTPCIQKTLNPVWGEDGRGVTHHFPVHDMSQLLKIIVYDRDVLSSDDVIGRAAPINLIDIVKLEEVVLLNEELEPCAGKLVISAQFLRLVNQTPENPAVFADDHAVAYFAAKILEAKGLPDTAHFPFKVRVATAGEECITHASSAKPNAPVAQALQQICSKLKAKGFKFNDIAEIVHLHPQQVLELLVAHGQGQAHMKEAVNHAAAVRAATNPQFHERLQLLIPDPRRTASTVEIELLDSKNQVLGRAKVQMKDILSAPSCDLQRSLPLVSDLVASKAADPLELSVTLSVRWLH